MPFSLFIFRRDLRIADNTGLLEALQQSTGVLCLFILTPEQLDQQKNPYKSDNCVQFMTQSLRDLQDQLQRMGSKLLLLYGSPTEVLTRLLKSGALNSVFLNADYTPYAKQRDAQLRQVCDTMGVQFTCVEDLLLNPVDSVKNASGAPYSKFTPFYNKAKTLSVRRPVIKYRNRFLSTAKIDDIIADLPRKLVVSFEFLDTLYLKNDNLWRPGGRTQGLKILKNIKKFADYNQTRDLLTHDTTYLSPHLKFGTVSIRETYYAIKDHLPRSDLLRQLYWRDFYHIIVNFFPQVIGSAMKPKYNKLPWHNNRKQFEAWKTGTTGFPIVDAAMRSMNITGFMHNRSRMIVSNFLVKVLLIDWRWGEKYFAQTLYDYDPANNNGGWQWSSSTGVDSQPYFRIFNPWLQGLKFDKGAEYIKKWIPELIEVPASDIHQWHTAHSRYQVKYPSPIIDYQTGKEQALQKYRALG